MGWAVFSMTIATAAIGVTGAIVIIEATSTSYLIIGDLISVAVIL